jgi:hypothetical protein
MLEWIFGVAWTWFFQRELDWDASGMKPKPCQVFFFFKNLYYFFLCTKRDF